MCPTSPGTPTATQTLERESGVCVCVCVGGGGGGGGGELHVVYVGECVGGCIWVTVPCHMGM